MLCLNKGFIKIIGSEILDLYAQRKCRVNISGKEGTVFSSAEQSPVGEQQ